MVAAMSATNLAGKRIYLNPGHGSFGPNDRPMATIPYPNLSSTGMPDTCGFYETNTNLWKCLYLRDRLVAAGATVVMSREECGPWPYEKVDGQYPGYSWDDYQNRPDYTAFNKNLSVICEEVESGNYDLFISVHSNAATDGSTANYPLCLYRGHDESKGGTSAFEVTCQNIWKAIWPWRQEMFASEFEYESSYKTSQNIRGDIDFYGSSSSRTSSYSGKTYTGYLGVLKHGCVGGLVEGYFHTYQPARHRALNHDYCKMEGYAYYRGIIDYFNADDDTKGYILGAVKDLHTKMQHNLYTYAAKTHDQWKPCNGAVVSLYKAGTKIAEYTVDDNYNGIFYFGNLVPGNDYTLDATCEGYHPLYAEYKAPITVTANQVTYPVIYLEDESYEPPTVVYETYPEPELPAYVSLASKYNMTEVFANTAIEELAGKTIRRAIVRDDNTMFVLALDAQNEPSLYLINPATHTVTATLPTDFCSVSAAGKLKLSDIAVTAEGVLIGCNEEAVSYTPSNKWLVYKWTENAGTWSGDVWLNTTNSETAGNYLNAIAGSTLAYAGSLDDGYIYTTAYTTGSEAHAVRYVVYVIADNAYAGAFRNQDGTHKLTEMGHDIQFTVSPKGDNKVMITASNIAPMEWTTVTTTASAPLIATMPQTFVGAKGMNYFKYAHHQLMVMPAADQSAGVALYDITDGVDQPKEVTLQVANPTAANPAAAFAVVAEGEITIYHDGMDGLSRLTTAGVDQPIVAHINAYGLGLSYSETDSMYTFTYTANDAAAATNIVFYQNGEEVGKVAVDAATAGANSVHIKSTDLPGYSATPTTWAVELIGDNVTNWGTIFSDNSMLRTSTTRVFNAVDKSPESDFFGRLYIMRRAGSSNSSERPYSGIYAYNPDYTLINTDYLKVSTGFGNPGRLCVAPDGFVYQADWADGYSGVYILNPADLNAPITQFFQGTRAGSGLFTNNGVQVGSSTPGLNIFGTGADTKLIVYNEDAGGTLPANGIAVYNIGQSDGTMAHTWGVAPNATYTLTMQANTEGTPVGTSHGIFVSQVRSSGNNNSAAPSLLFIDYNGTMQMASCYEPYSDIIDGSDGGGYAISADESMLILQGGKKQFYVFDIAWEGDKPVLTLRYEYAHGIQTIRQMNFDYAGNLVCSGESGLHIFTVPTDHNVTVVPAKSAFTVQKPFSGAVEGVLLDKAEAPLVKGEILTLTATVMPQAAENKSVTWASSNEGVVTVADGVVTAVASGNAIVTVTTVDGNFTATCAVTVVTPVTGIALDKTSETLTIGETLTLTATITPADADNHNVIWTTGNAAVATVADGVVTAVAAGNATITATSEDGSFTATCVITVERQVIAVTGVELDQNELALTVGETATLTAIVAPADADDQSVTWTSSNEGVATIVDGIVTAVAAGEATVTVTTVDGNFTATCAVTVNKPVVHVTGVTLNVDSMYFDMGCVGSYEQILEATVMPADATDKSITWESSAPTVASVVDGVVTALSVGEAIITVTTTDGGFTAACFVTVEQYDGLFDITVYGISYSELTIHNANGLDLLVFSAEGKLVAHGNSDIPMGAMPAGTYLVRLPDGKAVKIVR